MNLSIEVNDKFSFIVEIDESDFVTPSLISDKIKDGIRDYVESKSSYTSFDSKVNIDLDIVHADFLDAVKNAAHIYSSDKASFYKKGVSFEDFCGEMYKMYMALSAANVNKRLNYILEEFGEPQDIVDAIRTSLLNEDESLNHHGLRIDQVLESFYGTKGDSHDFNDHESIVQDIIEKEMIRNDTSSFSDFLPSLGSIPMVHIPNQNKFFIEDSHLSFEDGGLAENVIPSHQFVDLLSLVNITPLEFIQSVKSKRGVDLLSVNDSTKYLKWKDLCEKDLKELGIDKKRPSAIDNDTLLSIIDSSGNSLATPCIVLNLSPVEFINIAKSDVDVLITKGGKIGLHDFFEDSGHLESPTGPVVLNSDSLNWTQVNGRNAFGRHDLNNTYGYSKDDFNAEIKLIEKENNSDFSFDSPGM